MKVMKCDCPLDSCVASWKVLGMVCELFTVLEKIPRSSNQYHKSTDNLHSSYTPIFPAPGVH
jgi:hypothetical protein